jgi:hypothetical protein
LLASPAGRCGDNCLTGFLGVKRSLRLATFSAAQRHCLSNVSSATGRIWAISPRTNAFIRTLRKRRQLQEQAKSLGYAGACLRKQEVFFCISPILL